ncbi:MAG: ATP-grasp domain-containing protein, partial [Planctomycetia bacterium]|nr:ATP-grasp domain-containing protein [Planctomycetia bacterium]
MRRAIAADFRCLGGVEVVTTLDRRFSGDERGRVAVVVGPGEEEEILTRLASRCDYTVVIAPETGGVLHDRAGLVERAGGTSLGSSQAAISLAGDKWRLARHLVSKGIRTARTEPHDARSTLPRDFPYPAVIKPVDGAGSLHTYYCPSPDEGPSATDIPHAMIIQPYCPGRPLSATFLVGPSGAVRLIGVGRQRVEIGGGTMSYEGGRLP